MTKRLVVVLSLVLVGASCVPAETSAYRRTPGPTSGAAAGSVAPGGIQREPTDLPILPGEDAVVSAFARAGMPVRMIGASKFEGTLGSVRPARVFTAATTWGAGGADVLFLDEPIGDVRVCTTPSTIPRWTINTIFVSGRQVDRSEGGQLVFFSVGQGYFVQAWDEKTSDALRQGLGLDAPPC
ncbi:MAG: hypothetical protein E6I66_03820 [Chloroflexi bacterium]|nr:MAG: hypothetical protein E6I66_03820 [Chloroflexota bacterium]